jgi:hypothetical protein
LDSQRSKIAKPSGMNHKSPPVQDVRDMKMPTAAESKKWDARLTRMGCSIHAGTHPRWLEYEHEVGPRFFLVADAEYAYSAMRNRTAPKPHAE